MYYIFINSYQSYSLITHFVHIYINNIYNNQVYFQEKNVQQRQQQQEQREKCITDNS